MPVHPAQNLIITGLHRQMKLRKNMFRTGHHFDQFIRQILGMAGHKADPLNAGLIQCSEQSRKTLPRFILTVTVHILSQQHDFPAAMLPKIHSLRHNLFHAAASLSAADIGYNAEGTKIVAALHNADIGCIMPHAAGRHSFNNDVIPAGFNHHMVLVKRPPEELRKAVKDSRAESKIDKAVLLHNLFCHAGFLDHATAHANHELRMLLAHFLEPCDISECTPLSIVPDAAGIKNHKFCFFTAFGFSQSHFLKHACDFFRIMRVHLTSIGDHMVCPRTVSKGTYVLHILLLVLQLLVIQLSAAFRHIATPSSGSESCTACMGSELHSPVAWTFGTYPVPLHFGQVCSK